MLAIGGTADTGTPLDWGAQLAYDEVSSTRKALVAFEGAEHMLAANASEERLHRVPPRDLERR
jgi:hypothetical protein